jgi:hypothetical protein
MPPKSTQVGPWMEPPNPSGLCMCGCGQPTTIAKITNRKHGRLAGHPTRFLVGHQATRSPVAYVEADCGHETPCWLWQRACDSRGYGHYWYGGRLRKAHAVYWEEVNGPIPPGRELHHRCDVKSCVRPDHLVPLTRAEHTAIDGRIEKMAAKNRRR